MKIWSHCKKAGRFSRAVGIAYLNDNCFVNAAGMVYSTLMALIPFFALLFSLLSGFGALDTNLDALKGFLVSQLLPTSQETLVEYMDQFLSNSGALGVIGLISFLFTSLFLINAVTNAFNRVWGCRPRSSILVRFTTFVTVLVVGTLLLSASLSLTTLLRGVYEASALGKLEFPQQLTLTIFPNIFIFLALWLMILLIPSSGVRVKSALLGSFIGAVLFEATKKVFVFFMNAAIGYSVIYGSIAAIVFFLLWVYLIWLIIFLALEITAVHQYGNREGRTYDAATRPPAQSFQAGLEFLLAVADRFRAGEGATKLNDLITGTGMSPLDAEAVTDRLVRAGLLLEANPDNLSFLPGKPLALITEKDVLTALVGDGTAADDPRVTALLDRWFKGLEATSAGESLWDWGKEKSSE